MLQYCVKWYAVKISRVLTQCFVVLHLIKSKFELVLSILPMQWYVSFNVTLIEREWDIYVYRERVYCGMTGGKRDQSASTCNFKPI